jgi:SAM-dependent methyltransferase
MAQQSAQTDGPHPSEAERDGRALSFGAVAEEYDRYRPELPEAALDWLLPSECRAVLDLGAGTGAATCVLARRVPHVIAVEPDSRMRARIARRAPGARVLAGRAEAIPLEDASVDAVLVCSAWHWMEPEAAIPEIARVLRKGGVWGLLWNSLDRGVPWVAKLRRLSGQPDPEDEPRRSRRPEDVSLPEDAPFRILPNHTITWTWRTTGDNLVGLAGTYSSVIIRNPEERAEVLARVRDFVASLRLESGDATIPVPMACRCWKAVRT